MNRLTKSFAIGFLLIFGMGGVCQADAPANLPKSTKSETVDEAVAGDDLPPMQLEVEQSTATNPDLKKGKGCADVKGLEEVQGKIMVAAPDLPEAETISCEDGGCNGLPEAKLHPYTVLSIPTAKTEVACEEE